MSGICYIVGAGDFFENSIKINENDLVIAADGGLCSLEKIGVKPNIIIGDFDSLSYKPKGDNVTILPCEKDITDTWAALSKGIELDYKKFRIYGGTGGRDDHTIANIQNLVKIVKMGFSCEIIGEKNIITAISNGKIEFNENYKGHISVFSHSDKSEGVFEKGLKYCLENAILENFEPLGVSNEFTGKKAEISVENGMLLIIYEKQGL